MPADTGAMSTEIPPRPIIAVIVALAAERVCVQAGLDKDCAAHVMLRQSGPGPDRAASAARAIVQSGAAALVSFGVAGGLEPRLEPGTVVVPNRIILPTGETISTDPGWRARIIAAMPPELATDEGALLATDTVLETPGLKAAAADTTGAVAVDMESGAIAAVAAEAGLPAVAIRVIADGAADTLPPRVDRWIGANGRRRLAPIFTAAVKPGQWPRLAMLAQRQRVAQHALTRLTHRLAPTSFEFTPRR